MVALAVPLAVTYAMELQMMWYGWQWQTRSSLQGCDTQLILAQCELLHSRNTDFVFQELFPDATLQISLLSNIIRSVNN